MLGIGRDWTLDDPFGGYARSRVFPRICPTLQSSAGDLVNYQNGEVISPGDQVLIEGGATLGQVTEVLETSTQFRAWNVEEPGVMVKAIPFGLVFWPNSHAEPLIFVSRGEVAK